jgi:hypothetical protein
MASSEDADHSMYAECVKKVISHGDKGASEWIMKYRKLDSAWGAAFKILQSQTHSLPEKLLASQMLSYKSCRGRPIRDDKKNDASTVKLGCEVRDISVAIFSHYAQMLPINAAILKQLATSIAAQVARWPLVWDYHAAIFDLAKALPPIGYAFFLSVLPEISTCSRSAGLPPKQRIAYKHFLRSKISLIHDFFCTFVESSSEPQIQEIAIRGFYYYLTTGCVHGTILSSSRLLKGVFDALCFANEERLLQASRDFIVAAIDSVAGEEMEDEEFFTPLHLQHVSGIMMKYVSQPITTSLPDIAANRDDERSELIVGVLCQMSDVLLPAALKSVGVDANGRAISHMEVQQFEPLISILLSATTHPSWRVVKPTLFSWRRVADLPCFKSLDAVIRKVSEAVLFAAKYTEQYETEMDAFDRDEFQAYRNDARDTLRYFSAPDRRPSTFNEVVEIAVHQLVNNSGNWRNVEAGLHAVGALNKFCDKKDESLVPLFESFFNIGVQNFSASPSINCSTVVLIGQMAHWITVHPKYVSMAFDIVGNSIGIAREHSKTYPLRLKQNHVGCIAFAKLCEQTANPHFMNRPDSFFSLCEQLWTRRSGPDMDPDDILFILHGLCRLASVIPLEHTTPATVEGLLLSPLEPIFAYTSIEGKDLLFAGQCLEMVFSKYRPASNASSGELMWSPLSTLEKYFSPVMSLMSTTALHADDEAADSAHEALCRGIKSLLGDVDVSTCEKGKYVNSLIKTLKGMGTLYVASPRPCYLDVCQFLLDLSTKYQAGQNVVLPGTVEILQISHRLFSQPGAYDKIPSTASKVADLLSRLICLHTEFILSEGPITELAVNLLMVGLLCQDRRAGRSFIKSANESILALYTIIVDRFAQNQVLRHRVMEVVIPKIMFGLFSAANGGMPSGVLDELVAAIRDVWTNTEGNTMKAWLTIMMTFDAKFPSPAMKDKTKQVFVESLICEECWKSKARFKKLLKAFCGGKKKRKESETKAQRLAHNNTKVRVKKKSHPVSVRAKINK